jgi:hypothetical protein
MEISEHILALTLKIRFSLRVAGPWGRQLGQVTDKLKASFTQPGFYGMKTAGFLTVIQS